MLGCEHGNGGHPRNNTQPGTALAVCLPGSSGALSAAPLIPLGRGWAVTGVAGPQLTAPATHAFLTPVPPFPYTDVLPGPQTLLCASTSRPRPLPFSPPQMSFPLAARVQPYHLTRPSPASLELSLMHTPPPLPPDPGVISPLGLRMGPVLFSWSSSGDTSDSCFYGSVLPLILLCRFIFISPSPSVLLGRKVMTNLDSILKSRDITLPAKVHLVKAMVFPVVMYGCESWTIKKAEH